MTMCNNNSTDKNHRTSHSNANGHGATVDIVIVTFSKATVKAIVTVSLLATQYRSFVQLRRGAERAIKSGNMSEAEGLLQLSSYWRPTHRNVARRLWAVRMAKRLDKRSPFLKRLLLKRTYRDVR